MPLFPPDYQHPDGTPYRDDVTDFLLEAAAAGQPFAKGMKDKFDDIVVTANTGGGSGGDFTEADVRATDLAGLSTATGTAVTSADTVLSGIGKLQAQNTAQDTAIGLKAATSDVNTALALKANASDVTTALALKAPLASPSLTGTPTVPTAAPGTNTTQAASTAFVQAAVAGGTAGVASFNGRTGIVVPASGDYTKGDVGLGNVDNTADSAKPVSTAQQTALDAKVPTTRTINGNALSANVTLDADDIGDGTANKAYTATEKTKLAGIDTAATANISDAASASLMDTKDAAVAAGIPAAARTAISLTTTGSGAATYNSGTGVLNVPTPAGGGSGINNGTTPQTADFNITGTGTAGTLVAPTLSLGSAYAEPFNTFGWVIKQANGSPLLSIDWGTSGVIVNGPIKTIAPSGGTAQEIKFGSVVLGSGAVNKFLQLEVNGVVGYVPWSDTLPV